MVGGQGQGVPGPDGSPGPGELGVWGWRVWGRLAGSWGRGWGRGAGAKAGTAGSGGGAGLRGGGGTFLGGGGEGAGAHVTGSDRFWRQKGPRRPERDGPGAGGSEAAPAESE